MSEQERWEPSPVPRGDGRHDIGDDVRAAIFHRLHDDFTLAAPWMTAEQRRNLAMLSAASVRALLHELGTLRDLTAPPSPPAPSSEGLIARLKALRENYDEQFENMEFARRLNGGKPRDDESEWVAIRIFRQDGIIEALAEAADALTTQAAQLAALTAERDYAMKQWSALIEADAACCPEDVSAPDYIRALTKRLEAAEAQVAERDQQIETLRKALDVLSTYADAEVQDWSERNADRYWQSRRFRHAITEALASLPARAEETE